VKSIGNFIKAGALFAVPTLLFTILLDSLYYRKLTSTAWNFFVINVLENRSAEFGVSSPLAFIEEHMPEALYLLVPFVILGLIHHIYEELYKRRVPYFVIFVAFYLLIISNVPHKEDRF
jgi:phosphatidylinositol glycan class B